MVCNLGPCVGFVRTFVPNAPTGSDLQAATRESLGVQIECSQEDAWETPVRLIMSFTRGTRTLHGVHLNIPATLRCCYPSSGSTMPGRVAPKGL